MSAPRSRESRANKYGGTCAMCGVEVAAGAGVLVGSKRVGWGVTHRPTEWSGSPISGWYVGGCPGEAASLNVKGGWGPDWARVMPEAVEVEAATVAAAVSYRAYEGGRRRAGWRCEDAPCCGCCD